MTTPKQTWNAAATSVGTTAMRHSSSTARRFTPTAPPNWRTKFTPAEAYASSGPSSACTAPTLSDGMMQAETQAPEHDARRQRQERRGVTGSRQQQARQREQHQAGDDEVPRREPVGEPAADHDGTGERDARRCEQ